MKLFAAFIWFYLRILPSEKATFCGPDATLRTAPPIAIIHDTHVIYPNRHNNRSRRFVQLSVIIRIVCSKRSSVVLLLVEIIQLTAVNVHDKSQHKVSEILHLLGNESTRLTALVDNMLRFVMSIYSDELNYLHEKNSRRPF